MNYYCISTSIGCFALAGLLLLDVPLPFPMPKPAIPSLKLENAPAFPFEA